MGVFVPGLNCGFLARDADPARGTLPARIVQTCALANARINPESRNHADAHSKSPIRQASALILVSYEAVGKSWFVESKELLPAGGLNSNRELVTCNCCCIGN